MDVAFFFFRKQQMENCHIFFPKVYHSGHYVLGMYSLNFCYHFYFFCNNESHDVGYLFMYVNFILCSKMLRQDGLSMARNGINSNYLRRTFLLIMLMVLNLFILSNGLMLILCMSPSMFDPVTGYQKLSTLLEG